MNQFHKNALSTLLLCFLYFQIAYTQGCSDAGFCTINSLKPQTSGSKNVIDSVVLKNQLKIGLSYGRADFGIPILGAYLEYNRLFSERFSMDLKLTAIAQSWTPGLSDVYLNANYKILENLKMVGGLKIPLTNGNQKSYQQRALPMDYQTSLGTFDVIFGLGYQIKGLQLVAAVQQPFVQNKNSFLAENFDTNSTWRKFQSTNQFKRSGDALLRVSYPIGMGTKFKLTPGLLGIYHFVQDRFTDIFGLQQKIAGSQGFTLNGNVFLDYEPNKKHAIQLNFAMPFVIRKTRPDGLTRSFIINLEYRFKF